MASAYRISFIVPIYNAASFLQECLTSIQHQTLHDIEIICINDGSTDNSASIVESYAAHDERIKTIHQEHQGTSHARNNGIKNANGQYLAFVDADDYISPNMAKTAFEAAEKDSADIVVFGGQTFPHNIKWANDALSPSNKLFCSDSIHALFHEKGSRPFASNKLYKRELIYQCRVLFPESLTLGEDQAFQFVVFPRASRIRFISDKLYYYRQHSSSLLASYTQNKPLRFLQHVKLVTWVWKQWNLSGDILGHESDWGNWCLDHIFDEDVRLTEFSTVQKELRGLLRLFDNPGYAQNLTEENVSKLKRLTLLKDISPLDLIVKLEMLTTQFDALRQENQNNTIQYTRITEENLKLQQLLSQTITQQKAFQELFTTQKEELERLAIELQNIRIVLHPALLGYNAIRYLRKNGLMRFLKYIKQHK